jgi:serine phosphatase RsbU (regulator of sigma subunit)
MGKLRSFHFFILLTALLTLFSGGRLRAAVVTIDDSFSEKLLGLDLDFYEDPSGTLDFDNVRQLEFKPNPYRVPAFGYAKSTYWYRLSLRNVSERDRRLFLELEVSWIDQFSLFIQENGQWVRRDAGVATLMKDREVPNNRATHRLDLPARSDSILYLRVASSDTILLPMHLHSAEFFAEHLRMKELLYGIFAGIMAVAAFYGLVFFVYTYNKAYLYYFLNTLSWLVMFAAWDGYAQEFIFHDNYLWNKRFNVLMISSSLVWGALFTSKILETASYSKRLNRVVKGWVAIQILIALLVLFVPYSIMMQASATVALVFPFLLAATSIAAMRQRLPIARNYLVSWIFPIVGVGLFNGMVVGIIPGHPLFVYSLHFTVLMQSLFLSFLLSYHLREATQNASVLKVSVEAAGLAHSALMKNDLNPELFQLAYRYRPCEESGGDVFSCLADPRGSFSYVVVGDVSGHGITAAIISSAFTGALNAAVKGLHDSSLTLDESCKKVMNDVNQVMCDYFARTNHFASAVLVGIDHRSGEAIYINAGHRNIFLKNGSRVSALLRGGSLMGLQHGCNLTPVRLTLTKNDMLLLFTDGLVENDFGVSQKGRSDVIINSLKAHADPEAVLESIWQGIVTKQTGDHFDDDMTLLVIKLTSLQKAA